MKNSLRPVPPESESLLQRLLASPPFPKSRTLRELLKFFFKHGIDVPLSTAQIRKAPCFSERNLDDQLDPSSPRVEILRIRNALKSYFKRKAFQEPIRVDVVQPDKGLYQLEFSDNPAELIDSKPLDHFWLPYVTHEKPVRFITGAENPFWDSQPKGHRTRVPILDVLNTVYLPMGLLQGFFTLSSFLKLRGVECRFDADASPAPLDGSVIIIGDSPFKDLEPKHVSLPKCWGETRHYEAIPVGNYGDNIRDENGSQLFRCYAQAVRLPISTELGFAALQITAYHSVAVEAVANFLASEAGIERLNQRLIGLRGRGSPNNYDPLFRESYLASTVEELAMLFKITCSLTGPEALKLKPNIPRGYLRIEETELLEVRQPARPKMGFYNPAHTP